LRIDSQLIMSRLLFVTGTDTGVGKTTLTALLLAHGLREGMGIRAVKPFSSGDRSDERLIRSLQGDEFPVNLAHFEQPIAPWSAARRSGKMPSEETVVNWIFERSAGCEILLIEGAGGLLSPLAKGLDAARLIQRLGAEAIVVAQNRLGVLNHTLLVLDVLRTRQATEIKIALMESAVPDYSAQTNFEDIQELAAPVPVLRVPFFNGDLDEAKKIRQSAELIEPALRSLLGKKNPPDTDPRGLFP
jgi:dethiobiotin synthetase